MKVKEVETVLSIYQDGGVVSPPPNDIVVPYLQNNGTILNININKPVSAGFIRRTRLVYNIVDMPLQSYSQLEMDLIDNLANSVYFNIEKVLKTLVRSGASMITLNYDVTLFTYEANINTSYGSKRLSYPYTASVSENTGFPTSTDGWYTLTVLDIPLWSVNTNYVVGDIVYHAASGKYAKCIGPHNAIPPTTPGAPWDAVSENDWTVYTISTSRIYGADADLRIAAELLITRNVKQSFIYPSIERASYKEYDDKLAASLITKITAMREAAVAYLESGDPVKAVDMIYRIPFEYHTAIGGNNVNIISSNNFTL